MNNVGGSSENAIANRIEHHKSPVILIGSIIVIGSFIIAKMYELDHLLLAVADIGLAWVRQLLHS
mgnify:CR=1 FL=1